ncbi:hypothetical protein B1748_31290 [Paenibacillus sp. MY03]|uniref:hypothetical protein n=1 Tax=Paenibacillus sp. MY03 TaxID=302980 RepID=UPI000B3C54F4|nr:hypothetical protein [Paenibacillus sp. MY03]OUS69467.1 hypothetical protein B1748_31290 [Paenibacillus sp. MY03]
MSEQTIGARKATNDSPEGEHTVTLTRNALIVDGMKTLGELGTHHICNVCISYGGSCCRGCPHLADGLGCGQRNTSCTAWLCGFLKYYLYEIGVLDEWQSFWEQIPGQDYREDFTPERVDVNLAMPRANARHERLGLALGADLRQIEQSHVAIGFILTLREKLDKTMDQLMHCGTDRKRRIRLQRKIKMMTADFRSFHQSLDSSRS